MMHEYMTSRSNIKIFLKCNLKSKRSDKRKSELSNILEIKRNSKISELKDKISRTTIELSQKEYLNKSFLIK